MPTMVVVKGGMVQEIVTSDGKVVVVDLDTDPEHWLQFPEVSKGGYVPMRMLAEQIERHSEPTDGSDDITGLTFVLNKSRCYLDDYGVFYAEDDGGEIIKYDSGEEFMKDVLPD